MKNVYPPNIRFHAQTHTQRNKINTRHLEICAAAFAKNGATEAHPAWGNDWLAEDTSHQSKLSLGQATKRKVKYLLERRNKVLLSWSSNHLKLKFAARLPKSASAALGAPLHTLLGILLCRNAAQSPGLAMSSLFSQAVFVGSWKKCCAMLCCSTVHTSC